MLEFAFAYPLDLSDITYRFSNCKSTGRFGPDVTRDCRPFYKSIDSPIAANSNTLFQFENGKYSGAQGFRLPRDGVYNITVAGASSGEGVCNYHHGNGRAIRAQVRLTTDYEYLILVGQRGTSACDVQENADHLLCQQSLRPSNPEEAQICSDAWLNWTNTVDSIIAYTLYNFSGGGGGGGASMIWSRRVDTGEFSQEPIAAGAGGGGASAILNYERFLKIAGLNVSCGCPPDETYISFMSSCGFFDWKKGTRGYRPEENTSGAGGGWEREGATNLTFLEVDGKSLSKPTAFAEGGLDCLANGVVNGSFVNVFGGYGGGGGGCGSGGGGGGYTGGRVISSDKIIPGSGGASILFNYSILDYEFFPYNHFSDRQDGYVEIVASNCGCDGECVVYTHVRQFECLCSNGALLAEDGSSCYRGKSACENLAACDFNGKSL